MNLAPAQHSIKAWSFQSLLLEYYRYAPGPAEALPKHSHDDYQFCLSCDFPGEYYYRGRFYAVPIGSLTVIHPDEMHSVRDPDDRPTPTTFRMMYASADLLQQTATQIGAASSLHSRRETGLPFFANPVILDASLAALALKFHTATEGSASQLEQESLLLLLLSKFILGYADARPTLRSIGREREAVRRVREYLQDHYRENVPLDRLSQIANLSPYHLNRVFCAEVGIPPHQYQAQVRVSRAKRLLIQGMPVAQVAAETGFADQSHFARHFKRFMQVTPRQYLWKSDTSARTF